MSGDSSSSTNITAPISSMDGSEAMTNGVWSNILARVFPFPAYVIAPELYVKGEGKDTIRRADLMVVRMSKDPSKVPNKGVLAFEGKHGIAKDEDFAAQAREITAYMRSTQFTTSGGATYGMVAAGRRYGFLHWDGSQLTQLLDETLSPSKPHGDSGCSNPRVLENLASITDDGTKILSGGRSDLLAGPLKMLNALRKLIEGQLGNPDDYIPPP
ncbi:hypothetical protein LTR10_010117 [Elasticomyces elasticus]|nr:hypothetical protein LTR10_010117 [Elasticomyces elasticus]KAK4970407.1 hypothetical protein LTR42_008576 [Elasticomyces elasticus]